MIKWRIVKERDGGYSVWKDRKLDSFNPIDIDDAIRYVKKNRHASDTIVQVEANGITEKIR